MAQCSWEDKDSVSVPVEKGDDVAYGSYEDKYSVHVEQTSINKHTPRGFDYTNGSNQGWTLRGTKSSR